MKKNIIRISVALVVLLLLANIFAVSAFAANTPSRSEEPDHRILVDWTLSSDGDELVNETEGITYTLYTPDVYLSPVSACVYIYSEKLDVYDYSQQLERPYDYNYAVWLGRSTKTYYVTEEGREYLDSFIAGQIGSYRINSGYNKYIVDPLSESFINSANKALKNNKNVIEVDSRILDNCDFYYIEAFDQTGCFSYTCGAIFELSEYSYWYVNTRDLPDDALYSNGTINYDSASTIKMTYVNYNTIYPYVNAPSIESLPRQFAHEFSSVDNDFYVFSLLVIWFDLIIAGFIAPIPFFVVGLVLAFSKKFGKHKYWLTVSALALLWILLAIALATAIIIFL